MLADVSIENSFLGAGSSASSLTDIGALASRTIQLSFSAAGIILLFLFVAGGIGIIASAGSDNPEGVEKGKKAISAALTGFIVVFASYWIVKLIEIITGITIL